MKRYIIFIIMLTMISIGGCLVSSLHPFFKKKDKIYDPVMAGNWIDGDSCIWTIKPNEVSKSFMGPSFIDSSYQITYFEEDGLLYWTMGAPIKETIIINRCLVENSFEARLRNGTLPK